LSKKIQGIRVPEITLSREHPKTQTDFVRTVPGGFSTSKSIKQSLPVFYLRDKTQTTWFVKECVEQDLHDAALQKACPVRREFYSDFPDEPSEQVLKVARYDSDDRIRQYIYRSFLYSTYCHTSNSLVSTDGSLWLIDHASLILTPLHSVTDDIYQLKGWIDFCPKLMKMASELSILTEKDIEESLTGIDKRFWLGGKFTTPERAARFFLKRLEAWQKCFHSILS
jgi:hypothetical protein